MSTPPRYPPAFKDLLSTSLWGGLFLGATPWVLFLWFPHALQFPTRERHEELGVFVYVPDELVVATVLVAVVAGVTLLVINEGPDLQLGFYLLGGALVGGLGFFALSYWQIKVKHPYAFHHMASKTDVIYLVVSTFTTAGSGEIVPHSQLARGLVTVQQVFGFLMIAVVIAAALTALRRPSYYDPVPALVSARLPATSLSPHLVDPPDMDNPPTSSEDAP